MKRRALLLLLSTLVALPAFGASLHGVALPDTAEVGDDTLELTGMALRKVAIIKVYVAGLYLPSAPASGEAVLAADTPRRAVNHYLRGAGGDRICDGWLSGLADNTPSASAGVKKQFEELCDAMGDVAEDDRFTFTYVPDEGTTLTRNGEPLAKFPGKAFADALFACWIGPDPGPGERFKRDLLGL